MEDKASAYWDKCKDLLRGELTESAFRTWFAGIEPLSFENGVLKLQLQSQFVAEYIEDNYSSLLGRVLFRVCGPGTRLEYRIPIDSTSGIGITTYSQGVEQEKLLLARPPQSPASVAKQMQEPQLPQLDSRLNPSQTFDSFVQGEVNRMARTVALSVARNPGKTAFNPLFIYGGSGVGKTHLLNAIGNQVKALYPDKRVLYFSANDFKMQYMALGRNFVQRIGDIALVGLDTGEDKQDTNPRMGGIFRMTKYRELQTRWLAEAIETPTVKTAKFKVAFCHIPLFDPNPKENPGDVLPDDDDPRYKHPWAAWQRTCANMWGPLFAKAGVQLVCTGHQHRYRYDAPSAERPWTHIVGGQRDVIEGRVADGRLVVKVHDCENGRIVFDKEFE